MKIEAIELMSGEVLAPTEGHKEPVNRKRRKIKILTYSEAGVIGLYLDGGSFFVPIHNIGIIHYDN